MNNINSLPTVETVPHPIQEECDDYSYLDPALLGTEDGARDVEEINQFTLEDAKSNSELFAGQKGIHMLADETEQALSDNPNRSEATRDKEAIQTLEEVAFTGVVSEGIMTIRGCHSCIKEACALKGSLERNAEEGDKAMQGLINIRDRIMHRRFIRKWAENFSKYDRAQKRVHEQGRSAQSERDLLFMGSLRDSFRDMLMQHVQPQGRDKVMRDIYSSLPDTGKNDFAHFSNGVAVEIFVFEELERVVDRFAEAGREGCSVRFSTPKEDTQFGTDIILTLTDENGSARVYPIDAKSRIPFNHSEKRRLGENQYFGIKEVKGKDVYVVNPEGSGDRDSFVGRDRIGDHTFTSYSKHAKKGKFGSKIVSTLVKSS